MVTQILDFFSQKSKVTIPVPRDHPTYPHHYSLGVRRTNTYVPVYPKGISLYNDRGVSSCRDGDLVSRPAVAAAA